MGLVRDPVGVLAVPSGGLASSAAGWNPARAPPLGTQPRFRHSRRAGGTRSSRRRWRTPASRARAARSLRSDPNVRIPSGPDLIAVDAATAIPLASGGARLLTLRPALGSPLQPRHAFHLLPARQG